MNEIELHKKIEEVSKTIFSYCMAKTPTREEAEDLSQDILYELIKSAANILTIHYESCEEKENIIKALKKIRAGGKMAGLAIDLDTEIEVIDPYLKYLDLVLIMSAKAGKGGQTFNESAIKKIKYVRKLSPQILIEVDGGVNDKNAEKCVKAGADILVAGSYIYNNDAYEAIQTLKGKNG